MTIMEQRPIMINDQLIGVFYHHALIEIADQTVMTFDWTLVPTRT